MTNKKLIEGSHIPCLGKCGSTACNHACYCCINSPQPPQKREEKTAKEIRIKDVACRGDIDENLLKEDWEKEFEDRVLEEALNKIASALNGGDAEMVFRTAIRNTMPFLRKEKNPQPKAEWEEWISGMKLGDRTVLLNRRGETCSVDGVSYDQAISDVIERIFGTTHLENELDIALENAERSGFFRKIDRETVDKMIKEARKEAYDEGYANAITKATFDLSESAQEGHEEALLKCELAVRQQERQRVLEILKKLEKENVQDENPQWEYGYDQALSDAIKEIQDIK